MIGAAPPGGRARCAAPGPSSSPRPPAALGLASGGPGHASGLKSGRARGRATARPFCASAVRLRAVGPFGPRASPSSGALAPSRPRARRPPAWARCGGPVLALRVPPARCGLRCVPGPSGRPRAGLGSLAVALGSVSGSRRAAGRSGGPSLARGWCSGVAGGPLLPARGLSARCAGLGGLRSAPPRAGAPVLSSVPASIGRWIAARGVSPIRDNRSRPKQAGQRPGLDGGPLRGGGKLWQSRKLRTAVLHFGVDKSSTAVVRCMHGSGSTVTAT